MNTTRTYPWPTYSGQFVVDGAVVSSEDAEIEYDKVRDRLTVCEAEVERLKAENERLKTVIDQRVATLLGWAARAEKAEAERDAARALNESQARTIDLLRANGCSDACTSGQDEAKAARADKRAAMERVREACATKVVEVSALRLGEVLARHVMSVNIAALEDKP